MVALTPVHESGSPSRFLFLQCSQLGLSPTVIGLPFGNEEDFYFRDNLCPLSSHRQGHLLLAGCDILGMASRCRQPACPGNISYQAGKEKQAFLVLGFECAVLFVFSTNLKESELEETLAET